jgi:hypothetical protein
MKSKKLVLVLNLLFEKLNLSSKRGVLCFKHLVLDKNQIALSLDNVGVLLDFSKALSRYNLRTSP